jgi:ABC-2 type transport system ATP-binding protein
VTGAFDRSYSPGGTTPRTPRGFGASSLRLSYGTTLALDDVSLAASPGEVTAVVGGDGAGKTSLLRCLAGALRPASGEILTPGKQRTGYLPAGSGTYPDLTVAENLAFRASAYGLAGPQAAARADELITLAGLADARDRLAGQLSGGMRQKLGVISALLHRPELLILDEPSTGVDPVSRSDLWWLIASAAADGAAVILATTYLDDAQRAGTVLVLDVGRTLAAGTPEQIVAAMPGSLSSVTERPAGQLAQRSWRRGTSWRVWSPPGGTESGAVPAPGEPVPGTPVEPDLQDAVTVAALARELRERRPAETAVTVRAAADPHSEVRSSPAVSNSAVLDSAVSNSAGAERAAPLAETIGVTRRFGTFTAVDDVSIRVRPGEIVGLLGANGAGKTTLIRMLLGLIPASAGDALLLGEPPSRSTRSRIGYVPQGLGLYDDLTAAENMAFAAAVYARADDTSRGSASAVSPLALGGRDSLPVGQLPLGLQRRVAFAQALAHRPELLVLDEPTSGVDPLGRARLWQTIASAVEAGAGALVSTHYMEEAGECDRLIIMADGRVVASGTAAEIIGDAQVTVVAAADWAAAFGQLERAGLPVALAGRLLRVPGASPAEVSGALAGDVRVYQAPATLEERFFDFAVRATGSRAAA